VFSVETQSIAPIAETHTPAAPEPQRLKTLANLQRAIASIVKPRLLQYRTVHHDSERAGETQSGCRSAPVHQLQRQEAQSKCDRVTHAIVTNQQPTSSMRVTFTSARRRVRVAIGVASALQPERASHTPLTLDVEDVTCVSKSKLQTLMRNFSTVTQHAHASIA
jgi:hypothetical protein